MSKSERFTPIQKWYVERLKSRISDLDSQVSHLLEDNRQMQTCLTQATVLLEEAELWREGTDYHNAYLERRIVFLKMMSKRGLGDE